MLHAIRADLIDDMMLLADASKDLTPEELEREATELFDRIVNATNA